MELTKEQIDEVFVNANSFEVFPEFLRIKYQCRGKNYWYALRKAHIRGENLYRYRIERRDAFVADEPFRNSIMDKQEQDFLSALPLTVNVYRGMTLEELQSGQFGVSWSLDRQKAEFFAFKYGRNFDTANFPKTVCQKTVSKEQIIAYIEETEKEVIIIFNYQN